MTIEFCAADDGIAVYLHGSTTGSSLITYQKKKGPMIFNGKVENVEGMFYTMWQMGELVKLAELGK